MFARTRLMLSLYVIACPIYFYVSTFRNTCVMRNMVVGCISFFFWFFRGMLHRLLLPLSLLLFLFLILLSSSSDGMSDISIFSNLVDVLDTFPRTSSHFASDVF
jgi:hypothetical protein